MPSKPRHGRDYRKRTPRNSDLIQAPGATNGHVNVVEVNMTGDTQLTIDFDSPLISAGDAGTFIITQMTTIADLITDPTAGGAVGQTVNLITNNVDPATGRITVDFDAGSITGGVIDPSTMLCYIGGNTQEFTLAPGRLLYAGTHGQLFVIDTP